MADEKIESILNSDTDRENIIPHNKNKDYDREFIIARRQWLEEKTGCSLKHITIYSQDEIFMRGNVENLIGMCHIPLGIAGPLKINGNYAKGEFYIPLATTEGALVMTYHRGMRVIAKSGGANVRVLRDEMHITPAFYVKNLIDAENFIKWITSNYGTIKEKAESTTRHGKLLHIEPIIIGRRVLTRFSFYTEDAQGLNMINKACEKACEFIEKETKREYMLRSNYSAIKKASYNNIYIGQGKAVFADITIPKSVIRLFGVTPEDTERYFKSTHLACTQGGMVGENAHIANGIAALFMACGQDVADVSVSHIGISMCETTEDGSLYVSSYIPNLFVGTVGGGTALGTQKECLDILGCYGTGKVKKFAEIVGATVLAGEIAVLAALTGRTYVSAHEKYGRNRPEDKLKDRA